MELALHDPEHGYYASGPERLGPDGDFFTAGDVGPLFGECIARQLAEMDRFLGGPDPFRYVEFGAGRGLLAADVAAALRSADPSLALRLQVVLVDSSPGMRRACLERLPDAEVHSGPPPPSPDAGCALAVEWFDALPVHRVRRRGGALLEVFVDLDASGRFVEREGPPADEVAGWAERFGAAPEEGDEAEVATALDPALDALAASVGRGFVLVVDYGDRAEDLYSPRRRRGTLLAYHRHRAHEGVLDRPGEQDLTAHVNFSALERRARSRGLRPLGSTTQDRFLVANGILEAFQEGDAASWSDPARVKRRLQAKQLIHPETMGRAFRVWVASKGLPEPPALRGLRDPFAGPPPAGEGR
jgi:SAM-dependent MidA family methyltransferase